MRSRSGPSSRSSGRESTRLTIALLAGLGVALAGAAAFAQQVKLTGLAGQSVVLTAAEIAAMPHVTLTAQVEGQAATFEGVPLTLLLQRVGAPSGKALRGKELADVVIITARDGYTVVLALAETDPMVRKDQVILADRAQGAVLPDAVGPYRLVVEGDLRAARSARMVDSVELRRLTAAPDR